MRFVMKNRIAVVLFALAASLSFADDVRYDNPAQQAWKPKGTSKQGGDGEFSRIGRAITNSLSEVKQPVSRRLTNITRGSGKSTYYVTVEYAQEEIECSSISNLGVGRNISVTQTFSPKLAWGVHPSIAHLDAGVICVTNTSSPKLAWTEKKLDQFSASLEKSVGAKARDAILDMIPYEWIALSEGPHDPIGSTGHSWAVKQETEKQARENLATFKNLHKKFGEDTFKKIVVSLDSQMGGSIPIAPARTRVRISSSISHLLQPNERIDFYNYQMVATVTVYEVFTSKGTGLETTTALVWESTIPLRNVAYKTAEFVAEEGE